MEIIIITIIQLYTLYVMDMEKHACNTDGTWSISY